jgi:hypothetical protein
LFVYILHKVRKKSIIGNEIWEKRLNLKENLK